MAIIRSSHSDKLSINNQHEYFTLRMPKGTFTMSYRGLKGTGLTNDEFLAIADYVDPTRKGGGAEVFKKMNQLLNPRNLKKLVKDWDVSSKPSKADLPKLPKLKRGQTVSVDINELAKIAPTSAARMKTKYAVRGKVTGEVVQVTSVNVVVQVTKGGVTTNVKMPRTWVK